MGILLPTAIGSRLLDQPTPSGLLAEKSARPPSLHEAARAIFSFLGLFQLHCPGTPSFGKVPLSSLAVFGAVLWRKGRDARCGDTGLCRATFAKSSSDRLLRRRISGLSKNPRLACQQMRLSNAE